MSSAGCRNKRTAIGQVFLSVAEREQFGSKQINAAKRLQCDGLTAENGDQPFLPVAGQIIRQTCQAII